MTKPLKLQKEICRRCYYEKEEKNMKLTNQTKLPSYIKDAITKMSKKLTAEQLAIYIKRQQIEQTFKKLENDIIELKRQEQLLKKTCKHDYKTTTCLGYPDTLRVCELCDYSW